MPAPNLVTGERTVLVVMVNVTPDSFSEGGRYLQYTAADEQGLRLYASGANFIDVGGKPTRPDADPVDAQAEQDRALEGISALASQGVPVSVETRRSNTASAALDYGATVDNDASGGLHDPAIIGTVA